MGVAFVGLTLAASVLSGAEMAQVPTLSLAFGTGLLVAIAWLFGTRSSLKQTASLLDRRLQQDGALLTAFEVQSAECDDLMTRLLVARVAAQVSPRKVLRLARPLDPLPLAAPFVAAALLALSLDAVAPQPDETRLHDFALSLAGEIANARQLSLETLEAGRSAELGERAEELPGQLTSLIARVGELTAEWEHAKPQPADALEAIEQLRAEVEQSFRSLPPTTAFSTSVRELSNLLDAAAMRVSDVVGADSDGGGAPAGGHSLALGGSNGRIASLTEADGVSSAARSTAAMESERGTAVAIHWRPEYDQIVARWVESRRSVDEN